MKRSEDKINKAVAKMKKEDPSINMLAKISLGFREKLDQISSKIMAVEQFLREEKLLIPFETIVIKNEDGDDISVFIGWKGTADNHKNYRLHLIIRNMKAGKLLFNQPFIETEMRYRIKYGKYMNVFLKEYGEFINSVEKDIEDNKT